MATYAMRHAAALTKTTTTTTAAGSPSSARAPRVRKKPHRGKACK
jgi:hypothetical protein